ncbi:MAG: hypothetical protein HQ579_08120 [Candidatus Omnitrophica bacterium]|nr:hypothetical protein [Candidatus Omnitrophota bacterium]
MTTETYLKHIKSLYDEIGKEIVRVCNDLKEVEKESLKTSEIYKEVNVLYKRKVQEDKLRSMHLHKTEPTPRDFTPNMIIGDLQ